MEGVWISSDQGVTIAVMESLPLDLRRSTFICWRLCSRVLFLATECDVYLIQDQRSSRCSHQPTRLPQHRLGNKKMTRYCPQEPHTWESRLTLGLARSRLEFKSLLHYVLNAQPWTSHSSFCTQKMRTLEKTTFSRLPVSSLEAGDLHLCSLSTHHPSRHLADNLIFAWFTLNGRDVVQL